MQVILNGKQEVLGEVINLSEFLLLKGLKPEKIIVEYNGTILKQQEWSTVTLQDKDCLEVLNFVGGG